MTDVDIQKIAEQVSYTPQDIKRLSQQEKWADGAVVQIIIQSIEATQYPVTKNGRGPGFDLAYKMRLGVVDPDGEKCIRGPYLGLTVRLPLAHPKYQDTHVPGQMVNTNWKEFCMAVMPEDFPKVEYKGNVAYYDNQEFDPRREEDMQELQDLLSEKFATEAVNGFKVGGEKYKHMEFFCTLRQSGQYLNCCQLRAELRDNEALTPKEELITLG